MIAMWAAVLGMFGLSIAAVWATHQMVRKRTWLLIAALAVITTWLGVVVALSSFGS